MKLDLPMELSYGASSTTTKVWNILVAAKNGDLKTVKELVAECTELIYGQYNYTPPIHFAVREGHTELVKYLLDNGAHDPEYKTYSFRDDMQTFAKDRGYTEILKLLENYSDNNVIFKRGGDNGKIVYSRTPVQKEFEKAVDDHDAAKTKAMLEKHPDLLKTDLYFWGEGILLFAVKENKREMMDLLLSYGAKVPSILKWTQYYYFEDYEGAAYIMEKGMNPNTMNWMHVTILHDMAQKGNIQKAELLLKYGADINPVDEEYQSTPLGMAARWGHTEMVQYLLDHKADPNKAGALWATPLAWARKKGHAEIEKLLIDAGAVN